LCEKLDFIQQAEKEELDRLRERREQLRKQFDELKEEERKVTVDWNRKKRSVLEAIRVAESWINDERTKGKREEAHVKLGRPVKQTFGIPLVLPVGCQVFIVNDSSSVVTSGAKFHLLYNGQKTNADVRQRSSTAVAETEDIHPEVHTGYAVDDVSFSRSQSLHANEVPTPAADDKQTAVRQAADANEPDSDSSITLSMYCASEPG
jgi:hypothetical protein